MKRPVASFSDERLTDAPYEVVVGYLRRPDASAQLVFAAAHMRIEESPEELRLVWKRPRFLAVEEGLILARPDARGAFLRVEGRVSGWGCFLTLGRLRWQTDDLIDRLVDELGALNGSTR